MRAERTMTTNRINIKYASDELRETLAVNARLVVQKMNDFPDDNNWVYSSIAEKPFILKKYQIEDFDLLMPTDEKDYDTIYENALLLYEHLRDLPGYVLADERFWLWLMLEKFYAQTLVMMPITSESTFKRHWLFGDGVRRSIFFGVLSRLFFRVAISVDIDNEDPYEYTRFAFNNQYRIREFTWRTYSSEKDVLLGALKGIKRFLDTYNVEEDNNAYTILGKFISQMGSAKLLDVMDQSYIEQKVYDKLKEYYDV